MFFCLVSDFGRFEKHDKKLKDWRLPKEWDWCETRMRYTSEKAELMNYFNVPRYDVPELLRSAEDGKQWRDVWYNVSAAVKFEFLGNHPFNHMVFGVIGTGHEVRLWLQ